MIPRKHLRIFINVFHIQTQNEKCHDVLRQKKVIHIMVSLENSSIPWDIVLTTDIGMPNANVSPIVECL
jgi:hypothetical protein